MGIFHRKKRNEESPQPEVDPINSTSPSNPTSRSNPTSPASPTVRLVTEDVRAPQDADKESFDGDDIAPALALMDMNERADSALGSDDGQSPVQTRADLHRFSGSSLDKPLPSRPDGNADNEAQDDRGLQARGSAGDQLEGHSRDDVARDLGVANILDLNDSEDMTYHSKQAPAVVHETIVQPVHEILHEVTTRDIHQDHFYHRILPVQEVEVLPARHFVEDAQGGRHEMLAKNLPGRSPEAMDRKLAEYFKHDLQVGDWGSERRAFTAREFPGTEGTTRSLWVPLALLTRSSTGYTRPGCSRRAPTTQMRISCTLTEVPVAIGGMAVQEW